jgi:hypothetical protein
MGKARGGGSGQERGQGRSPALSGGRKGKGKVRIDPVVGRAAIADGKKAGKQKEPPSGGAGGEASGRGRPGPPQMPELGGSADRPSATGHFLPRLRNRIHAAPAQPSAPPSTRPPKLRDTLLPPIGA